MWLREPLVVEVADNTVSPLGFQFWDEAADAPLNIAGYSFACNVASSDGKGRIAAFNVSIVSAALGQIDIEFNGNAFGLGLGQRVFSGQLIATGGAGQSVTAARLVIIVNEGIN